MDASVLVRSVKEWNRARLAVPNATVNLRGADLSGVNLRGADLSGANLRGANFSEADLSGADLSGADLRGAYLRRVDLRWSNLSRANLVGAALPTVVKVLDLDRKILDRLESGGQMDMSMSIWYTCSSVYDRAGWAVALAGEGGRVLADLLGPHTAAALIYAVSYPALPVPDFHASNEAALEDMRRRAICILE